MPCNDNKIRPRMKQLIDQDNNKIAKAIMLSKRFWLVIASIALLSSAVVTTYYVNQSQREAAINAQQQSANFWQMVMIKPKDNLGKIFAKLNLPSSEAKIALDSEKQWHTLNKLKPGHQLYVLASNEHQLEALIYPIDDIQTLSIYRQEKGLQANIVRRQLKHDLIFAEATIKKNMTEAGRTAGLPNRLVSQLMHVFAPEINFAKEVHKGDHFSVLYDRLVIDDNHIHIGDIQAAEFTVHGKTYKAIRFKDPKGHIAYYTQKGLSIQVAMIRTPVFHSHITSRFSRHRWHPILHFYRSHLGVDYGAPQGSPVIAAGNGTISYVGSENGYGNVVKIKHNGVYNTLYAHLSRFAKGIKRGHYVHEGQTIAYVGSTGLATGSHLHFEIHIGNVAYDPLKVKLPVGEPIPSVYRHQFLAKANQLLARLENPQTPKLAEAKDDKDYS